MKDACDSSGELTTTRIYHHPELLYSCVAVGGKPSTIGASVPQAHTNPSRRGQRPSISIGGRGINQVHGNPPRRGFAPTPEKPCRSSWRWQSTRCMETLHVEGFVPTPEKPYRSS